MPNLSTLAIDRTDPFWDRVIMHAQRRVCWPYYSTLNADGYGTYRAKQTNGARKIWIAHRYAFLATYGHITHLAVVHICKNRFCVNPYHLKHDEHLPNTKRPAPVSITNALLATIHTHNRQMLDTHAPIARYADYSRSLCKGT
jgi:hypothetical protein